MFEWIKIIDIFGTTFQFTTLKSSQFTTRMGGLMTVFSGVILIVFCFLFGWDFFFKLNPKVLAQIIVPNDYLAPFQMTAENFVIPWRIGDSNNLPVDFENKLYPVITYYRYETNSSGQFPTYQANVEFAKCTNQTAQMPEFTSKFKLEDYYCMDWSKDNFTFGGYWDGSYTDYFELTLYFCPNGDNFSPSGNCTDINVVQEMFDQTIFFDMMSPQYYFVPDDLQNPLRINFINYFYSLKINMQKTDRMYFKQVTLIDDQGWIFSTPVDQTLRGESVITSDFSYYNVDDYGVEGTPSSLYDLNFYCQKNYDQIGRSYMKFQDLAAIIGGFLKIVLVFGGLFSFLFNNIIRDEIIYNHLFEFEPENKDKLDENRFGIRKNIPNEEEISVFHLGNSVSRRHINNTNNNLIIHRRTPPVKPQTINFYNHQLEEAKNKSLEEENSRNVFKRGNALNVLKKSNVTLNHLKKKLTLKFGIWFSVKEFVCPFMIKNKDKLKNFRFLKNYFKERLDVLHYLKTLEIVERMKLIFFNYYQNMSFEFLKTPNLCNKNELGKLDLKLNRNVEKQFNELVDYYSHRVEHKQMDETDEKILECINPEIKRLSKAL